MMEIREKKRKWITRIFGVLSLVWMGIIFLFSAQPAVESTKLSTGTVDLTLSYFSEIPLLHDLEEKGILEFAVRKLAHMAEYGILAIFLGITIYYSERYYKRWQWKTGSLCCLYACSDEFHQLFVPGRSGQIRDVVIDTFGVFCSVLILWIFLYITERQKRDNTSK